MVAKEYWNRLSRRFIDIHRDITGRESLLIHGYSFDIFPKVFSPAISSDTVWFAEKLVPKVKGKSMLEIGTGTGVIACLAKLGGAKEVVATDINPNAVANAIHNANKFNLDISVLEGDLYSPVTQEKFDVIFWNHPFNYVESKIDQADDLSFSVFDYQYTSLKRFFLEGKRFLSPGGLIILGTSNVARIRHLMSISTNAGFSAELAHKQVVTVSKIQKAKMDVRLYIFTPIA